MKANNVIEINGKLYDAQSGKPIPSKQESKVVSPPSQKSTGHSIDGVAPRSKRSSNTSHAHRPKAAAARPTHKARLHAKRSTTLNRRAVKPPQIHAPSIPANHDGTNKKLESTPSSTALKHADSIRIKRAQSVHKSPAISKFSAPLTADQKPHTTKAPLTEHLTRSHEQFSGSKAQTDGTKKDHVVSKVATAAVKTQTIHSSGAHKKHGRHITKYATGILAALVLAGYVAYLNVPGISMKIAAHQAGFAATMPSYKPAGYSLSGPIASSPGQVRLSFASNTDDRNFNLTQQPTTWDSTALLENVIVKKSQNYLTYQDRGLTIYIYDGSSAAWVNNGKLYQVEGNNSNLDTDQLLKLATSV